MYIVSACLMGENCRYNGGNSRNDKVIAFLNDKDFISLCPEELAGLVTPRSPNEIFEGKVRTKDGKDLTELFHKGAEETYRLAENQAKELNQEIEIAIMKSRSPSCGCGIIHDGTFAGKLIKGNGITSELLIKKGIKVITEEDL